MLAIPEGDGKEGADKRVSRCRSVGVCTCDGTMGERRGEMMLLMLEKSAGGRHEAGFQGSGGFWSGISRGPGDRVPEKWKRRNSQIVKQKMEEDEDINAKVLVWNMQRNGSNNRYLQYGSIPSVVYSTALYLYLISGTSYTRYSMLVPTAAVITLLALAALLASRLSPFHLNLTSRSHSHLTLTSCTLSSHYFSIVLIVR